jgi:SAM-dependent methyltransferase
MQTAISRWEAILKARAEQMDAAYARLGRTSADFWDRRARGFHRATRETSASDPFLGRLEREVSSRTTVLDVGAGTGRFALALAPHVRHVTAVEPNTSMLNYMRQDASALGLSNISYVETTWQAAPPDLGADFVICSHVLYPILEIEPFLRKLLAAARQVCYIYMRATHIDALTGHLWRHFHGDERRQPPGYIHVLDVLFEMGVYADVEIVRHPLSMRFPSLAVAVDELLEQLILPPDEATRGELQRLLEAWLIERDAVLVPPAEEMVYAVLAIPAEEGRMPGQGSARAPLRR